MGSQAAASQATLSRLLAANIDQKVAKYWDKKVAKGIVPTEALLQGKVDPIEHERKMEALSDFEASQVTIALDAIEGDCQEIHYFGIGTGHGLQKVTKLANAQRSDVVAYDISAFSCAKGEIVFNEVRRKYPFASNRFYHADIEFACDFRFVNPKQTRLLVVSRVLDVLNSVSKDDQKMARTARKIGTLLRFLKVLLIHPEPEQNEHAVFSDTTLHPLVLVAHHMQCGLGQEGEVVFRKLTTHDFYGHIYTAALFEKR